MPPSKLARQLPLAQFVDRARAHRRLRVGRLPCGAGSCGSGWRAGRSSPRPGWARHARTRHRVQRRVPRVEPPSDRAGPSRCLRRRSRACRRRTGRPIAQVLEEHVLPHLQPAERAVVDDDVDDAHAVLRERCEFADRKGMAAIARDRDDPPADPLQHRRRPDGRGRCVAEPALPACVQEWRPVWVAGMYCAIQPPRSSRR